MTDSPWAKALEEKGIKIPKDTDELMDIITQFVIENNAHEAIHAITTSLGMICMLMENKDLENVRTVFDQMKFTVMNVLSEEGWE